MLRSLVLALAVVLTAAGAAGMAWAGPAALPWLVFGAVLLIGALFERVRYKRLLSAAPDPRFQSTEERFRDPTSGTVVRVYVDPATGERIYIRD